MTGLPPYVFPAVTFAALMLGVMAGRALRVSRGGQRVVGVVLGLALAGGLLLAVGRRAPAPAPRRNPREAVLLLHGLARTGRCMDRMQEALEQAGYDVLVLDYPSTEKPVETLSREHLAPAIDQVQQLRPARLHFVAHSMGNILIRHYLAEHRLPNLGRIVMLGPPNQGSEVVDRLGSLALFQWINGPAGLQLGTAPDALPNTLPAPRTEIGIVAGTRSINWILSTHIPGPDDGKVSPDRAALDGMKEFITVPVAHPFLMMDARVIDLTRRFLQKGTFAPDAPAPGEHPQGRTTP